MAAYIVLLLLVVGVCGFLVARALRNGYPIPALGVLAFAGVAVAGILALMPGGDPKGEAAISTDAAPMATPRTDPSLEAEKRLAPEPNAVQVTLQNYQRQGDNVSIVCSGPTGKVVCKPSK